jgi:hypothetical protein
LGLSELGFGGIFVEDRVGSLAFFSVLVRPVPVSSNIGGPPVTVEFFITVVKLGELGSAESLEELNDVVLNEEDDDATKGASSSSFDLIDSSFSKT